MSRAGARTNASPQFTDTSFGCAGLLTFGVARSYWLAVAATIRRPYPAPSRSTEDRSPVSARSRMAQSSFNLPADRARLPLGYSILPATLNSATGSSNESRPANIKSPSPFREPLPKSRKRHEQVG